MELELRDAWECLQRCEAGYSARLDAAESAVRESSRSAQASMPLSAIAYLCPMVAINVRLPGCQCQCAKRAMQRQQTQSCESSRPRDLALCEEGGRALHRRLEHPACEQDEIARMSAAHVEALRQREQEVAATVAAAVTDADSRAAAASKAADTALSELGSAHSECRALKAALEQVPGLAYPSPCCQDRRPPVAL